MSWHKVLQLDFDDDEPLRQRVEALFAQQRATWPALREGEQALAHLYRKTLSSAGESIVVQMNPARRASTTAKTDAQSVAARRCFLCPENMPAEERGVAFANLVIMPNPYPILPMHCTVAAREHQPQQLAGRIATFLQLASEIGSDLAALYNGPRCGASAPDHFHFQAARSDEIPMLSQLPALDAGAVVLHISLGRTMLIFSGTEATRLQTQIELAVEALRRLDPTVDEPMLNLLAHRHEGCYRVILFPRVAHRPACYFADGSDRLAVSPAILEMCGILVTTESADFARVDTETARAIYAEVSVDRALVERVAATLL